MGDNQFDVKHVAVIMDGNGRWAKACGKERKYGHRAGAENLIKVAEYAVEIGIEYLTVYAFSTENWDRPEDEKKELFRLLKEFYGKEIKRLVKDGIKIKHIGDISAFPKDTYNTIVKTEEYTEDALKNKTPKLTIVIALNYGSRNEITRAIKKLYLDVENKNIIIGNIDDSTLSNYLDTKDFPEVDLLIRTSGEKRLSNFLLYQLAYTEMYFTETFWPDFSKEELIKALEDYKKRTRRFGGL